MSKYEFRFLKATWGIAIDVTARFSIINGPVSDQVLKVADDLFLDAGIWSSKPDVVEYLVKGLKRVAASILASKPSQTLVIHIENLEFNECDFHIEGLAHAIAGWAAQEFGFAHEPPHITFDKAINRYIIPF